MRGFSIWCTVIMIALTAGCLDLRELSGEWRGRRIGEAEELRTGFADEVDLTMVIAHVSPGELEATVSTSDGLLDGAQVTPIPGAEADVLARTNFDGAPEKVFFSFVETSDGGGDALALIAIFDDRRIEVRLLRGGPAPLYGIFPLRRA